MTDEAIVALFWSRSELALEETKAQYGRYVQSIAYGILQDREDAGEIANDTYLKAWNTIPPQRPSPLKAFLGRIARQLALNRAEQKNAAKRGGGQYAEVVEELSECLSDASVADFSDSLALQTALNGFLRSLPLEARRVFLRRYWYTASVSEIAQFYGMSESKVKSLLLRTRNKLKLYLEQEGIDV